MIKVSQLKLVEPSNILNIRKPMSNFNLDLPQIEGLSRRQQSKLQRLIKTSQLEKANSQSKSYKRKPNKERPSIDHSQRKMIKTQTTPNDLKSDSGSSSIPNQINSKKKIGTQIEKKIDPKNQKVFNPAFLQGQGILLQYRGEQGLFEYIMMYSYSEKQKRLEAPEEDYSQIWNLEGTKLTLLKNPEIENHQKKYIEEFNRVKQQIEQPFDEGHRQIVEIIFKKVGE